MSYVYTVARLRALENYLLDASFFSRLIDSVTLEEALKILGETVYAQWISPGVGFDKVIDSALTAACDELARFVPDRELLDLCRMPYDFNNVKVILKSLFKVKEGGERRYDLLSGRGSVSADALLAALESEEYFGLPYGLGDVVPRCRALWEQTKNPQQAEMLLDSRLFASMRALAETLSKKLKSDAAVRWVACRIDAENLRSAVRLQRLNHTAASALPFFHPGGTIHPESAARLLGEPLEQWSRALSHTGLGSALEALQDRADVQSALTEISKGLDDAPLRVLERVSGAFAPENVILYLLRKEAEARNLRVALVCVANGLNREFARRLLSHA